MSCCTPFWRSSLHTCISTKSYIGLGSRLRTVSCKIKMLSVKYIYIKKLIKNRCNKKQSNHLLCMRNEQNREQEDSDYPHWTMIIVWNAWASCVECIPHIQPLRLMTVWNLSKPARHSSLETLFLLHMFWISFTPFTKNQAIYMVQINYLLVNKK
jgi:hypothetical protein